MIKSTGLKITLPTKLTRKSGSQKSLEFEIDELLMCCAGVVYLLHNLTNGNSKLQVLSIFILSYDIKLVILI